MPLHKQQLQQMLDDIAREVSYTRKLIGKDTLDKHVIQAMRSVPRDAFVPANVINAAYANGPLPIGHGQTISQPYIVALMTDLLELDEHYNVLEVGTGSGYQTAVLAELCHKVYTIENIPELAQTAQKRLRSMGYDNIEFMTGNGYHGWPENSPYDAIIVTAAASHVPPPLETQLKPGARMVIPIGLPYMRQKLSVLIKSTDGRIDVHDVLDVAFVPLRDERPSFNEVGVQ
jgi:protein-L-isoaspartate(D-aspartate) O-methyltransferase